MTQNSQATDGVKPLNTSSKKQTGMFANKPDADLRLQMVDRSAPRWAKPLSWFFSVGIGCCVISLCIITIFFLDLSAYAKEPFMALILVFVGCVPFIGLLVFEYAHAKALSGYRVFRTRNMIVTQAFMAVVAFLLLEFVHPVLGLGILIGAGGSYLLVLLLSRRSHVEPMWDFLPEEAISILSGRDEIGRKLASNSPQNHALLYGGLRAIVWLSLLLSFGLASWLAAKEIVSPTSIVAVGLVTFWAVEAAGAFFIQRAQQDPLSIGLASSVTRLRTDMDNEEQAGFTGFKVEGLTIAQPGAAAILSDVKFHIDPGQVLGVQGPAGSGKTMLLRTLVGPHDMAGFDVAGCVRQGEVDLWERSTNPSAIPALFFPSRPLLLPTTGASNLSFFQTGSTLERGKRILEQLVFASDVVDRIVAAPDARHLSGSEKKALAFARGFLISPTLYLVDRPEDGISEKMLGALAARIQQECRAGRSFVLVTESRALLDICDKLLVLQDGRVIDFGPSQEIRARQSSGWQRFVGTRSLETEENLESWIRSHFLREGDEANRRKACMVAAEMLAFSCQNAAPLSHQAINFEFKHFEGYCLIKMVDREVPVSSGVLQRAQSDAENHDGSSRLSPLAAIFKECSEVETTIELDQRVILGRLDTYDPRKSGGKPPEIFGGNGNNRGVEHHVKTP